MDKIDSNRIIKVGIDMMGRKGFTDILRGEGLRALRVLRFDTLKSLGFTQEMKERMPRS